MASYSAFGGKEKNGYPAKCGMNCFAIPNRRLLSKQVLVGLRPPFDLIAKQKGFCEARPTEGGASEQSSRLEKSLSFDWSQLLNEVRTFFEKEFLP